MGHLVYISYIAAIISLLFFPLFFSLRGARRHAVDIIVNDPFSDLPFFGSDRNFTYVCVFGSESSFFPLNLPILQFRPFFHFDNQSHCWLISYPEQSLEDNFKVNKTVEDLRHKNVV